LAHFTKRLGLIAGYAAPYEPPRDRGPEQHIDVDRPGELVGIDCFYVGRLRGTEGAIWQLTAIDVASSFAWAELVICKQGNPTALQASKLARRVARDLKAAGWRLERVLSDNGNEFRGLAFRELLERLTVRHTRIHAGRPQTNGNVEALHKTILDECWRPAFARYIYPRYTALRRELDTYLAFYNFDRVHHGRLTRGRIPADIVYGARKMEARRADPVGTSRRLRTLDLVRVPAADPLTEGALGAYGLDGPAQDTVHDRVGRLWERIEAERKSRQWRLRQRIGTASAGTSNRTRSGRHARPPDEQGRRRHGARRCWPPTATASRSCSAIASRWSSPTTSSRRCGS
jgi:hypothetical protein